MDAAIQAGTTVQIVGGDDKAVATFVTPKRVQSIVYSSSAIKSGEQYQVYTGGTASGSNTGGLAESGSLGSATSVTTVTAGAAPAGGFGRRGGR